MNRPSRATTIATAALCFSVAGTGVAAGHYLITSTSQISPSVVASLRARNFQHALEREFLARKALCPASHGACSAREAAVRCPSGFKLVSGGYVLNGQNPAAVAITEDAPLLGSRTWIVDGTNFAATPITLEVFVLCAM